MSKIDHLIDLLALAPPDQIDEKLIPRFTALIGESDERVAQELKEIRDLCVHDALASDFAIMVLGEAITIVQQKE